MESKARMSVGVSVYSLQFWFWNVYLYKCIWIKGLVFLKKLVALVFFNLVCWVTEGFIAAVVEALLVILLQFFSSGTVFMWLLMNNRWLTLYAGKNCSLFNSGILARENHVPLCSCCQKGRIYRTHMVLRRCDLNKLHKLPRYTVPHFLQSTTQNCLHRVLFSLLAADLLGIWGAISSGICEQ